MNDRERSTKIIFEDSPTTTWERNGSRLKAHSTAGSGGTVAASKLRGRGSAAGAGSEEDITLGSGLTMTGTTVSASGVGGTGGGSSTGAYASRPAAGTDGLLFLPNNSFYIERDNGSSWAPWGPIYPITAPVDGDFAWINQGTATTSTTNGGTVLYVPAATGTAARIRKKTAPSTPYTITAAFLSTLLGKSTAQSYGLFFRQSSDGKLVMFRVDCNGTNMSLTVTKWSNPSTAGADYAGSIVLRGAPLFLRIADNGTNRICSISANGQHFVQFHTIGRTDFLIADEVGWGAFDQTNTYDLYVTLLSWAQG